MNSLIRSEVAITDRWVCPFPVHCSADAGCIVAECTVFKARHNVLLKCHRAAVADEFILAIRSISISCVVSEYTVFEFRFAVPPPVWKTACIIADIYCTSEVVDCPVYGRLFYTVELIRSCSANPAVAALGTIISKGAMYKFRRAG